MHFAGLRVSPLAWASPVFQQIDGERGCLIAREIPPDVAFDRGFAVGRLPIATKCECIQRHRRAGREDGRSAWFKNCVNEYPLLAQSGR
jgi:hypothetical protein